MSSDAWKPTSAKKGSRNSGTNKSINDRPCKNCGAVREHPQKTDKYPPAVYCRDCHKSLNISNKRLRMRPNEADKKELERLSQEARARSIVSRQDAAKERVAAIVAECATQEEIDAEYDKLTEQIKEGRPAAGGLFWRRLCGLVCLCNCAICLLAVLYSPTVFMVFCYLCGCIPAKTNDIVAIPKVYIEWAVAVVDLMDERYPGRRDPRAFCGIRALQHKTQQFPRYGNGTGFDEAYDEVERVYQYRVSLIPGNGQDPLMPGATYDKQRDWLAVFSSESAGQVRGVAVLKIPLLIKDDRGRYRKTVVEAKCFRRQFVMAYLFTSVLAALSWGPLARDFAVLKEQAKPVTIGVQISIISDPTRTHIQCTHRRRSTRSSRRASSLGRMRSGCWGRSRRFTPPSSRRCTSFYWSWAAGGC